MQIQLRGYVGKIVIFSRGGHHIIVSPIRLTNHFEDWRFKSLYLSGVDPDFLKRGSTLELQLQPSCKSKTKKKKECNYLLKIASLHLSTNHISLFISITTYIACYIAPQKNTTTALESISILTALLDYFELEALPKGSSMEPFDPPPPPPPPRSNSAYLYKNIYLWGFPFFVITYIKQDTW